VAETACRSCGRQIIWAATPKGRAIPLDPNPAPDGNLELIEVDGTRYARSALSGSNLFDEPRYVTHYATCPNADAHRKRQERAT